jgi:hypothetical protein
VSSLTSVLLPSGCSFLLARFERGQTFKPKDASHFEFPATRLHPLGRPQKQKLNEVHHEWGLVGPGLDRRY